MGSSDLGRRGRKGWRVLTLCLLFQCVLVAFDCRELRRCLVVLNVPDSCV